MSESCWINTRTTPLSWRNIQVYLKLCSQLRKVWRLTGLRSLYPANGDQVDHSMAFQVATSDGLGVWLMYPMTDPYVCHFCGNMYHQYTPNVSIYTIRLDPMGMVDVFWCFLMTFLIYFCYMQRFLLCPKAEFVTDYMSLCVTAHEPHEISWILETIQSMLAAFQRIYTRS